MPGRYTFGSGLARATATAAYERKPQDPVHRRLRIFTIDPTLTTLEGAKASITVPYEPLQPGPKGCLFDVTEIALPEGRAAGVDLNDPRLMMMDGLPPSPSNPQFHQQMLYAVCSSVYATFRTALGRQINWGFDHRDPVDGYTRLRVIPHDPDEGQNAEYIKKTGELRFGYYRARPDQTGRVIPNMPVFTCLNHDIVAHELTHALLDGMRSSLLVDTSKETEAFHEGFADLVAIFQHFSYGDVVRSQIQKAQGKLDHASLLTDMARNFGLTTSGNPTLRSAIDSDGPPRMFDPTIEDPHALGSVLVSAIFDAFLTVFRRKTDRYVRLATNGLGKLPDGYLSADLLEVLADEASHLASEFLSIAVRAIDYCPPVDMQLGEFLRAMITADHSLVPDDPWGYREALIDSFAFRKLYPPGVMQLSEDSLLWRGPRRYIGIIPKLSFSELRFSGDPGMPASADDIQAQAVALGDVVTRPDLCDEFGLVQPGGDADPPVIQSIRTSRRVGPDGQVVFDLVAEVTQKRTLKSIEMLGGSTIILGPRGEIRYVISKNVDRDDRLKRQSAYQKSR